MEKESKASYDLSIGEKANTPFARRLQQLITDKNGLKEYLDVSSQAINQYIQGTAFPKTENIIKMSEYYGVSADYLLGRTDIPNMDTNIQAVHKLTGLTPDAIAKLNDLKDKGNTLFLDLISILIENNNCEYFLALLCGIIDMMLTGTETKIINYSVNDINATIQQGNLLKTTLQTKLIEDLPAIAEAYKQRNARTPHESMRNTERSEDDGRQTGSK